MNRNYGKIEMNRNENGEEEMEEQRDWKVEHWKTQIEKVNL